MAGNAMVALDDHRAIATRMSRQGLRGGIGDIAAVVRSLVGMQSQEFGYALWSVAQRTAPGSDASHQVSKATMDTAFADGVLVRTHVLRLTWHFALPEDIRWLLRLTAPRLKKMSAYYDRQLGLDDAVFARTNAALADAVSDGRHRTRAELSAVLDAAGIPASGQRAGNIMMRAEFDEVLISGPPRGKQHTYAAFDERVPPDAGFDADESLAELARRFFTTRGPATVKDLATWASLTLSQARRGLAQVESELDSATLDGATVYLAAGALDAPRGEIDSPTVDLVQGYDEIVMSYSESRGLLAGGAAYSPIAISSPYLHTILVDGILVGHWRHRLGPDFAVIETALRRPLNRRENSALLAAVRWYGEYLGVPATLG